MYRVLFVAALASVWVQAARADLILTAPAGLEPGQQFQIAFVTDGTTLALSTSISDYNSFVNNEADTEANGSVYYNSQLVTFSAIGSTSTVGATSSIGVNSAPVYLADGTLIANSTTTGAGGLWSGSLLAPLDEDLTRTTLSANYVWTGTDPDGTADPIYPFGSSDGVTVGGYDSATDSTWVGALLFFSGGNTFQLYGISDVLTVAAVPEPSSMLLTLMGLGVAFGWRLARRRQPAEQPQSSPEVHS